MKVLHRGVLLVAVFCIIFASLFIVQNPYKVRTTLSYLSRPIWDKLDYPNAPIHNFATPELFVEQRSDYICAVHNGTKPRPLPQPEVWDAIIFSHEIDMLEIHLTELEDVVDRFVILESNVTYSGVPKPLFYDLNKDRFIKWRSKISYKAFTNVGSTKYKPGDFGLETLQRNAMTRHIEALGISEGTLVLVADVDEIPYVDTLRLVKTCQLPSPLHLQLKPYVYSFEWISGDLDSWHIQMHEWVPGKSFYKHSSKSTENYISDAGVHCSFCFKSIEDFQFKMRAYSHSDRLGDRPDDLLKTETIQKNICEGRNIFGMLPESYSYLDLFTRWKGTAARTNTARDAPKAVKSDPKRYSYLLPGGCKRELKSDVLHLPPS